MNQLPYEMPSDLEAAIVAFVSYYNYRRYHKALGNVTPSDVLKGRRQEILLRRKEVQAQTIERRRQHNRAIRELTKPLSDPDLSGLKVSHFCWLPTPLDAEMVLPDRRTVGVVRQEATADRMGFFNRA